MKKYTNSFLNLKMNEYFKLEAIMEKDCEKKIKLLPVCSFKSLLSKFETCSTENSKDITNLYINSKISLVQVGLESVNAKIYKLTIDGNSREFIIKVLKNNSEISSREIVFSCFGINQLHEFCPNFPKSYGFFECGYFTNENTWCLNIGNPIKYFIQEYIDNTITVESLLSTGTMKQKESFYFQLLTSLLVASQRIKFCHNDFHDGNIMIKKLNSPKVLEYKISVKGKTRYIYHETDFIIKIIDFDYSTCVIDDVIYVNSLEINNKNLYFTILSPLTDLYKLTKIIYSHNLQKKDYLINYFVEYFNLSDKPKSELLKKGYYYPEAPKNDKYYYIREYYTMVFDFYNFLPKGTFMYDNNNYTSPLYNCVSECNPGEIIKSISSILKTETYPRKLIDYQELNSQGFNMYIPKEKMDMMIFEHEKECLEIKTDIESNIKLLGNRMTITKFSKIFISLINQIFKLYDMLKVLNSFNNIESEKFMESFINYLYINIPFFEESFDIVLEFSQLESNIDNSNLTSFLLLEKKKLFQLIAKK